MFGPTGDLMNTLMATGIAQERAAAAALKRRGTPAPPRATVGSAVAAGWHRVRALVATVFA